jgi:FkbM family methyltransferase
MPRSLAPAVNALARLIPLRLMPAIRLVELGAAALQGKGWGTATIDQEVRLAASLLPNADAVVIDGGANRGDWSRAMLTAAGQRLRSLTAFEPSNAHAATLSQIRDPRFEWVRSGLGESTATTTLHAAQAGVGSASVYNRRLDHLSVEMSYAEQIQLTSLDEFTVTRGIERIDFLKLDVEGHELAVLAGAKRLLKSGALRALSFEFGGCDIDARVFFQDFWYLLGGHGYRLFRVAPPSRLVEVPRYTEDLECFRTSNYFAVATPAAPR